LERTRAGHLSDMPNPRNKGSMPEGSDLFR
jgi:hypothetical protein